MDVQGSVRCVRRPGIARLGRGAGKNRISGIFVGRHAAWRIEAICLWGAAGEVGKARLAAAKDGTDFAEAGGRGNASPSANSSTDQVAHSAAVRGTGLFRARSRLGRSRTLDRRETVAPPLDRAYGCEATGKKALSGQLPASRGTATSAGRAQEQLLAGIELDGRRASQVRLKPVRGDCWRGSRRWSCPPGWPGRSRSPCAPRSGLRCCSTGP